MPHQHHQHHHRQPRHYRGSSTKLLITFTLITFSLCLASLPRPCQGLWLFQDILSNRTSSQLLDLARLSQEFTKTDKQEQPQQSTARQVAEEAPQTKQQQVTTQQPPIPDSFTLGGIRPASIASLLNTVSETGFSYFNVHDQCRSRTACDVGYMLYKKLNFIHNWIIRTSVRTLVDSNNVYAMSWNNGMMGKNCTHVYPACNQSPLDSLMSFALLSA